MSGIFLSLIHEIAAIIFTAEAVGATNHFVVSLYEFVFLQIYAPRIDGSHESGVFAFPYNGPDHHVGTGLGVETAKFKMLISNWLVNMSVTDRYLHQISNDAAGRAVVPIFDYHDDACSSFVKNAKFQISSLVQPQAEIVVPFEFKSSGVFPNVLSFEILCP